MRLRLKKFQLRIYVDFLNFPSSQGLYRITFFFLAVVAAKSGDSCVMKGRGTVTLMTRLGDDFLISSLHAGVQCAGLLECGQNNCAAKSGRYWDEEVN